MPDLEEEEESDGGEAFVLRLEDQADCEDKVMQQSQKAGQRGDDDDDMGDDY